MTGTAATEFARPVPGRQLEIAALGQLLGKARTGVGGVACIDGLPGAGKSRLIAAAAAISRETGMTCLRATGRHLERDLAFGVVIQLFAQQPPGADPGAQVLASTATVQRLIDELRQSPKESRPDDRLATFHRLFCLLRDFSLSGPREVRPLAITVDDVNAADAPSLRFLAYVGARSSDVPIALVVAARRGEPETDADAVRALRTIAGRMVLRPGNLPASTVEKLVRDDFPQAGSSVIRAFGEATEGNPLLLVELLAEARSAAGIRAPSADEIRNLMPAGVLASIESGLAVLPAEASALARAVAVIGGGASLERAAAAARLGPGAALRSGDALAAAGLLRPGAPLRFATPLLERSLRRSVLPLERLEMQQRAADAPRADDDGRPSRPERPSESISPPAHPGAGDRDDRLLSAAEMAIDSGVRDESRAGAAELAALTPSEHRVADLAAAGLTTRQIAAELFVTPKTVEFHLRHVYQKLQIPSSRAELTARLRPSGPAPVVGDRR